MRPGQNKQRMRGRNNNPGRKGPNPLTRSFESNGPDVKIRGTAQHIGEKYLQLARDAQTSGDPVAAENYLQHAEHYFRLIAAAQLAQAQATQGYQRGEAETDEAEDDDDVGGLPDRFASPFERQAQLAQQAAQPPMNTAQPFVSGDAPPRLEQPRTEQPRDEQPPRSENYRQDSRPDYRGQGRGQDYRGQEGRQQDNRQQDNRGERPYNNERNYNNPSGAERQDRNGPRENRWQPRGDNRPQRSQEPRENRGPREPYQPRDYAPRDNSPPREPQDYRPAPSVPYQPVAPQAASDDVGLPAFITAPVRVPVESTSAQVTPAQPLATPVRPDQPRVTHGRVGRPPKVQPAAVSVEVASVAAEPADAPAKTRKVAVRRKRPVFEEGDLLATPAKDD
jgi:Domain of unknown function (DUF4167)